MARTRTTKGKFESSEPLGELTDILPLPTNSKKLMVKISLVLVLLLVISPWIFIMLKHNSLGSFSNKISDFYSDTFSCNSRISNYDTEIEEPSFKMPKTKEMHSL